MKGEWKFLTVPGCPEEPETEADMIIRLPKTEDDELRPCVFEIPGGGLYAAGSGEFGVYE